MRWVKLSKKEGIFMSKSIVIFYTWSGHTRKMAEIIADLTGADLLEIEPVTPYSQSYNVVVNQAKERVSSCNQAGRM